MPVPVTDITTYHLALRLGFGDLHQILRIPMLRGQPDILGAIWVEKELVLIDRHLDPENNPSMLGRYRYSVGHEIGHWQLHRSYVAKDPNQTSLFIEPIRADRDLSLQPRNMSRSNGRPISLRPAC